ncbi:hypothetical protein HDU82_009113 [Entophlyctis luteolus]|nr:hypothetical protein HDU82_009113 [Entophlyctis luteolus]
MPVPVELVSQAVLTASSTESVASQCPSSTCDINNVKQLSENDQADHTVLWQSARDSTCSTQTFAI